MTDGEKMVWAAVFAKGINYDFPPHVARSGDRSEWEASMVATAIENAAAAIWHLRKAEQSLIDGWGNDDEVTEFWREMAIGGEQ